MYAKILSLPRSYWEKINPKILFFTLAGTLLVIFALYAYMVNKTIMNVVAREKTERDISSLSSSLGELEYTYMTLKNNVTLELAYMKGFHDAEPTQFITRGPSSLSYNSR